MGNRFDTEEEANVDIALRIKEEDYFCPLIEEGCKTNCRCYNPPRFQQSILSQNVKVWYVYGSYCDNPMLVAQ